MSEIITHEGGGVTFSGPDAVRLYQALTLHVALRMHAKTGIKPNRAWTPTAMLKLAGTFSGKTYKRGQYAQAAADVKTWADAMQSALPMR